MWSKRRGTWLAIVVAITACGGGTINSGPGDGGGVDAASPPDATVLQPDGGPPSDAAPLDAPIDAPTVPPPFPVYSHGTCPTLVGGPTDGTSLTTNFATGTQMRQFHVVVPKSYDGTQPWPLIFAWHWLNASASSFIGQGELESATEQMHFIAVVPDKLMTDAGNKVYEMDWPFVETYGAPDELVFFDDMLACVAGQYKVDPTRVYAVGVSAGALWATYLSTTDRADHFAAVESLSGGLGADPTGVWKMPYVPQPHKFPAIVLWGGPSDWLIVDFQTASMKYRDALRQDHHFVVECTHDAGHAIPPVPPPPDGGTLFAMLWQFMLDHPYALPPGTSPYQEKGLPSVFPSWCQIAP
jgi:predicted esterase